MPPLPVLPGLRVVRALEKASFEVVRIRGSHYVLRHQRGHGDRHRPGPPHRRGEPRRIASGPRSWLEAQYASQPAVTSFEAVMVSGNGNAARYSSAPIT